MELVALMKLYEAMDSLAFTDFPARPGQAFFATLKCGTTELWLGALGGGFSSCSVSFTQIWSLLIALQRPPPFACGFLAETLRLHVTPFNLDMIPIDSRLLQRFYSQS